MATKKPPSDKRFQMAISDGDIKLVERLIAQGASIHGTKIHDFPAQWAIENGQQEILKLLIRHGVDPRSGDGVLILTALYSDQRAILKFLISLIFSPDLWRGKSRTDIEGEADLIYQQIEKYAAYDELNMEQGLRNFRLLLFDAAMTCWEHVRPDPPRISVSDIPAKGKAL